jgi:hypothetical protein
MEGIHLRFFYIVHDWSWERERESRTRGRDCWIVTYLLIYDALHIFAPPLSFFTPFLEFFWVSGADQGICTSFKGISFWKEQLFYIGDHAFV